ncbi:Ser/Thr protein phosphatase [Histomonas meleagridis]|uniref:Ser/Thr protein phosphatase n=1 Tax=Histomonas meleagridis TaxID=135588 RepID=UPI00355A0D1A|nr:Ser/Thr protein phosphatase [Histomonas meleagridis]KAH0799618.1 Ser/Thr protein phosphatase [Histomonas meleagridis]
MGNFRSAAYIISQYVWLVYIIMVFVLTVSNGSHTTGDIISKSTKETWSDMSEPVVIAHLTDVHVNHLLKYTQDNLKTAVEIIRSMNPQITVLTGDLVDNMDGESIPKHGLQQPEDRKLYEEIIGDLPRIEMEGNHDNFARYTHNPTFNVQTLEALPNYVLISFDPFERRTSAPPLGYWMHPRKELLDNIENALNNLANDSRVIMFNHYPTLFWNFGGKSSSGKTYQALFNEGKIDYFITGHKHPEHPIIQHNSYTKYLEFVGCDLFQHKKFNVITIDNDRLVYHEVDITNPKLAFVTHPVPKEQLSSKQIFNERHTSLRVIVYSDKVPSITASGAVKGALQCEKKASYYLCSLPIETLEAGEYNVELSGDVTKSIDFVIGDSVPAYNEDGYFPVIEYIMFTALPIVWLILLFITFPLGLPQKMSDPYMDWINGVSEKDSWVVSIFLGFVGVKIRLSKLNWLFRISAFFGVIAPFFVPIFFEKIDGHLSIIWLYGLISGDYKIMSCFGPFLTLIYLIAVMLPVVLLMSSLAISFPLKWPMIIDGIVALVGIAFTAYVGLRFGVEAGGLGLATASPLFVILPIYFYLLIIIWRLVMKFKNQDEIGVSKETLASIPLIQSATYT